MPSSSPLDEPIRPLVSCGSESAKNGVTRHRTRMVKSNSMADTVNDQCCEAMARRSDDDPSAGAPVVITVGARFSPEKEQCSAAMNDAGLS